MENTAEARTFKNKGVFHQLVSFFVSLAIIDCRRKLLCLFAEQLCKIEAGGFQDGFVGTTFQIATRVFVN